MYRHPNPNQLTFETFHLPFGGKLRSDNRWVILAKQIPWQDVEQEYARQFPEEAMGSPAKSSRLALGALILKERMGVTDRELVAQIAENPYLSFDLEALDRQCFLGLSAYQADAPFHHSMLTHFRKRLSQDALAKITDTIAQRALKPRTAADAAANEEVEDAPPSPQGKLILDATCAPAHQISDRPHPPQ